MGLRVSAAAFPLVLAVTLARAEAPPSQNSAEVTSTDSAPTFRAKVNVVVVPVVVRDRNGHAVGNLKRDDFRVFDKGKQQVISQFSVERGGVHLLSHPVEDETANTADAPAAPFSDRFVAYVFDDVHLSFEDLSRTRTAAIKYFMTSLRPTDPVAIFTTSGQNMLDFTTDRTDLMTTLNKLQPRPISNARGTDCPDLSYYMADLIQNKNDQMALQAAVLEAMACANLNTNPPQPGSKQQSSGNPGQVAAQSLVQAVSSEVVSVGDHETRLALGVIEDAIRRCATAPGQRMVVVISPGFVVSQEIPTESEVMDRAVRANVIISAVDARGLFTDATYDASQTSYNADATRMKQQYDREAAMAQADVLAELANGTGGTFFENNNDLADGLRRVAAPPEWVYVIGFSPQNVKLDGSFHGLKVTVDTKDVTLQARRGYYAPRHAADPEELAKEEIGEALFSRDELHQLPVALQTQFFKTTPEDAKLTLLVHVDVKGIPFQKVEGRNKNNLTVVSALFDRNGNYVSGQEKIVQLRLRDQTLENLHSGITVRTGFDVKPGGYMVRLVVRDSDGQMMSTENRAVEIP